MHTVFQQIEDRVTALKASPQGQRLAATDARIGRVYGIVRAAIWLVCAVFVVGIAALLYSVAEGWIAAAVVIVAAASVAYILWRAISGLVRPQNASTLVVDELRDRVAPVAWAVSVLKPFCSRIISKSK